MPLHLSRLGRIAAILVIGLAVSLSVVYEADARRAGGFGGGFGSRGSRTFQAPAPTRTAPSTAAPIERSMTPKPQNQPGAMAPQAAQRPGLFGGMGRSLIGGLLVGGLLGAFLGYGFGGAAGMLGMLLQIALVIGAVMLAMRFFRSRQSSTAAAGAGQGFGRNAYNEEPSNVSPMRVPTIGSASNQNTAGQGTAGYSQGYASAGPAAASDEIGLKQDDLETFERLLTDVQTAYGKEDYATLRNLTTPEAMSYLAEELGQNATDGLRNSVSDVKLLQADIAEAWAEGDAEYATTAMRYSSVDAMVDRTTGRVVKGDDGQPSQTTEVWTFVRKPNSDWKLAAIQDAA
ncbi:Tim44 domain-containing protein [Phyllobacterium sp. LjRoot231]|uniref:Tim44 domain-containing protein n=1 Tax=Phyllobacterium sp. LjRoot231 TaxID=3342289 RepID=UPI003ECEA857